MKSDTVATTAQQQSVWLYIAVSFYIVYLLPGGALFASSRATCLPLQDPSSHAFLHGCMVGSTNVFSQHA